MLDNDFLTFNLISNTQKNTHFINTIPPCNLSQRMLSDNQASSIAYDQSEIDFSAKEPSYYGSTFNPQDSDSEQINNYHQLLFDNISEFGKNQTCSTYSIHNDVDSKTQNMSVKSYNSFNQAKSINSELSKNTLETQRTLKLSDGSQSAIREAAMREKRKFMKLQMKRIKQQLRNEELKEKREHRHFREFDIDFDRRRLRGHNSKMNRRRLTKRTLELLSKKFDQYYSYQNNSNHEGPKLSIRQIGQLFDMGNSTIHKLYQQWMEDPSFYERINRQCSRRKAPEKKVTLERLQHIARLIKENPFLTQNQLTNQLNKIEGLKYTKNGQPVEITRTTVARLLKVGKFKKKRVKCVPKQRNTFKSLQKRHEYCTQYLKMYLNKAKIYFLDQSGFNLYMTRDKAWARPNQQITVNCPISKGKRFSLIAIIADDGLTHWRIIQGTYRKCQYLDFVKQLFARIKEELDSLTEEQKLDEEYQRQRWLILDNCAIHDKQQTVRLAKECGVQILYLPPYSPQLNPIQNWFNQIKCKIRKSQYSGENQLLDLMHSILKKYEQFDFSAYYQGVIKHVEKGVKKEKF